MKKRRKKKEKMDKEKQGERKRNSRKSVMWLEIPVPCMAQIVVAIPLIRVEAIQSESNSANSLKGLLGLLGAWIGHLEAGGLTGILGCPGGPKKA